MVSVKKNTVDGTFVEDDGAGEGHAEAVAVVALGHAAQVALEQAALIRRRLLLWLRLRLHLRLGHHLLPTSFAS